MTQRPPLPNPDEISDDALADYLERRFTPGVVPPCRICGAALSPEKVGGGEPTEWACSPYAAAEDGKVAFKDGRRFCDEHYDKSFFTQYQTGDAYGLEIVQRFRDRVAPYPGPVGHSKSDAA